MKLYKVLLFLLSLSFVTNLSAQINYQATVRDNNNQPVTNQVVAIDVEILQNGDVIYTESHNANTGNTGIVNLSIGEGVNITSNFSLIDWSNGDYEIQLTIDGEQLQATPIRSVPIAEYAKNADNWVANGNTISLSSNYKNVGIGTSSPAYPLHIISDVENGGIKIENVGFTQYINLNLAKAGNDTEYGYLYLGGETKLRGNGVTSVFGGKLVVNRDLGIGSITPIYPLHILSDRVNKGIKIENEGFSEDIFLHLAKNSNNVEYGFLDLGGGTKLRGNGITSVFNGKVQVNCLQINGGCDIKEDLNSIEALEPGDIVVIDENNAGQIKRTNKENDRKVLGVISGANGVNPGISLSQNDVLEGEYPLTMVGRVYVKVVGKVEIGDLLTTSKKPGYAMAVKDYENAYGTVIGKSMTANLSEDGMVLVFVNLQ